MKEKEKDIITLQGYSKADGRKFFVVNSHEIIFYDELPKELPPPPPPPSNMLSNNTEKVKRSFYDRLFKKDSISPSSITIDHDQSPQPTDSSDQPKSESFFDKINLFEKLWNRLFPKTHNDILHIMLWNNGLYLHSIEPSFKTHSSVTRQIGDTNFTFDETNLFSKNYSLLSLSWFKQKLGLIGRTYVVILDQKTKKPINFSSFSKSKIDGRSLYLVFTDSGLRKGFIDSFKEAFSMHFNLKLIVLIGIGIAIVVGIVVYLMNSGLLK